MKYTWNNTFGMPVSSQDIIEPVPRPDIHDVLGMLQMKYQMNISNFMIEQGVMFNPPRITMEVSMDTERLTQLCEDIKNSLLALEFNPWGVSYSTSTTPLPPEMSMTVTPVEDDRPCIKCTAEHKENFIRMIEKYCDTCFLGECDPQDGDDCRKCLERRVRWEIE